MKHNLRLYGLLMLPLLLVAPPVLAQMLPADPASPLAPRPVTRDPLCEAPFEAILKMGGPHLEYPTVWDVVYRKGNNVMDLFDGVPLGPENVLVVGRDLKKSKGGKFDIILSEINSRGRIIAENIYAPKGVEEPRFLGRVKGGFVLVSDLQDKNQVRLSLYDAKRKYKSEKIIADPRYNYSSGAYAPINNGTDGFVVAVNAESRQDDKDKYGILFRFSADGKQLWRRHYTQGVANRIRGLSPLENGSIIATGQVEADNGTMAGWILALGSSGEIMWQRSYARGAEATLKSVVAGERGYFVIGDAQPGNGEPLALWMMAVNNLGEPQWQRYYRRNNTGFSAVKMTRTNDGRFAVTVNALAPKGSGGRDHVRLLTLSARGAVIDDEAYINGVSAMARNSIVSPEGARVVFSTTTTDSKPLKTEIIDNHLVIVEEPDVDDGKPRAHQGWIFLGAPLPEKYNDPCLVKASP